jgi:hypothetical protein
MEAGMNRDVTELVELPDPATHPLVHPLDLPQARRPFRTAWLIGALTSPPVGALAVALVLVAFRLDRPDVPAGARDFTFGMGAAAGLLVVAEVATRPLRGRGRRVLYPLPGVVAVLGGLAVAWGVLFGTAGPASAATVAMGAALMLAAGAVVGGWKLLEARRGAGGPVS